MTFAAFLRDILGVWQRLTRPQRVWVLVSIDGVDPADLTGADRDIARRLFGDAERVPPEARHVVAMLKGARVGGTWLCALYLLFRAVYADLAGLAAGEQAFSVVVAPDMRLGRQALRYAHGAAKECPELAALIVAETSDSFTVQREDGRQVVVECLPASRGGAAQRGRTLVAALLDEASFFRDPDSGVINDTEVYRALVVRVLPGGKMLIISTAWLESGLLHNLVQKNHGKPTAAVASICPTLEMRDDDRIRQIVAEERERDPLNASREFDAEPMPGGAAAFFDPRAVDAAVDEALVLPRPRAEFVSVGVGADFGFRSDSSALVVVQRDTEVYTVSDVVELRPEKDKPLQPSAVVANFAGVANRYGATSVRADGHYRESIREHLSHSKLYLWPAPEGAIGKAETYQLARTLLLEKRVRLPKHDRLLRQAKEVIARPTAGGGVSISSPRWRTGGHGDLVSAFVLALYDAHGRAVPERPEAISDEERERRKHRAEKEAARLAVMRNRGDWLDHEEEFGAALQRQLMRQRRA